jgi:hypothetical protein
MYNIWNTIGTILATGMVMVLGYWAQHYWASKREIRDARRRYRESVAAPVRGELNKLQTTLAWRGFVDIKNKAEKQGISLEPETIQALELLEGNIQRREIRDTRKVFTELLPLAGAITDESVKAAVERAFLLCALSKKIRDNLNITDKDMEQHFKLAYQKLEDFVTLAD